MTTIIRNANEENPEDYNDEVEYNDDALEEFEEEFGGAEFDDGEYDDELDLEEFDDEYSYDDDELYNDEEEIIDDQYRDNTGGDLDGLNVENGNDQSANFASNWDQPESGNEDTSQLALSKEKGGMSLSFVWIALAAVGAFIVWKIWRCYRGKQESSQRNTRAARSERALGDMQMVATSEDDDRDLL
jgi:hypothetical protein